jgi:hypothetical protein
MLLCFVLNCHVTGSVVFARVCLSVQVYGIAGCASGYLLSLHGCVYVMPLY